MSTVKPCLRGLLHLLIPEECYRLNKLLQTNVVIDIRRKLDELGEICIVTNIAYHQSSTNHSSSACTVLIGLRGGGGNLCHATTEHPS